MQVGTSEQYVVYSCGDRRDCKWGKWWGLLTAARLFDNRSLLLKMIRGHFRCQCGLTMVRVQRCPCDLTKSVSSWIERELNARQDLKRGIRSGENRSAHTVLSRSWTRAKLDHMGDLKIQTQVGVWNISASSLRISVFFSWTEIFFTTLIILCKPWRRSHLQAWGGRYSLTDKVW